MDHNDHHVDHNNWSIVGMAHNDYDSITQREKCYFSPRLFKAKLFCEPKFSEQKEPVQTWVSISSSTDTDTIVIEGIRFAFELDKKQI